jgi:hypothetical protein
MLTLPTPELGKVLYSTNDYAVRIDEIIDAESKQPLLIYAIISTETGVREAELRGYANAIQWSHKMQHTMNEVRETEAQEQELLDAFPPEVEVTTDTENTPVTEDDTNDFVPDTEEEEPVSKAEAMDILNG